MIIPLLLISVQYVKGYFLGPNVMTHDEAESYCVSQGTNLATIKNNNDRDATKALCKNNDDNSHPDRIGNGCWIGLYLDDTVWTWTDGSPLGYGFSGGNPTKTDPWWPGEPNQLHPNENCGLIYQGREYNWIDATCKPTDKNWPICNDRNANTSPRPSTTSMTSTTTTSYETSTTEASVGPDWDVDLTCDSLKSNKWINKGTLGSSADINTFTGTATSGTDGVPALCFNSAQSAITYINYNTNSRVNPELTMEIWVKPTGTATGNDWLLGHDNGGYDRSIIVYDNRYNGIAMGVGNTYRSTVSYPEQNKWTQIIATFSKATGKATIYKNDGSINIDEQQVSIVADSGGEPNIGLNGLKNYGNHNFVGCIAQVRILNRVLTIEEVEESYAQFQYTIMHGCESSALYHVADAKSNDKIVDGNDHVTNNVNKPQNRIWMIIASVSSGLCILLCVIFAAFYFYQRKKKASSIHKYVTKAQDEDIDDIMDEEDEGIEMKTCNDENEGLKITAE